MLITTTPSIEGRPVRHDLGLVDSETILGANLFRDLLASLRDIVGSRAYAYESTLTRAREMALEELERRARLLGADAEVQGCLKVWLGVSPAVDMPPRASIPLTS